MKYIHFKLSNLIGQFECTIGFRTGFLSGGGGGGGGGGRGGGGGGGGVEFGKGEGGTRSKIFV